MFALKSENKLKIIESKNANTQSVTDKLLLVYKKLKKIAQYEIDLKNKFKLASLDKEKLGQLKSLESSLGFCLVAYERDYGFSNQKFEILTQINKLLNDYSKLIAQNERKTSSPEDFSKFFE